MKTHILRYPTLLTGILFLSLAPIATNADPVPISVCEGDPSCPIAPTVGWDGAGLNSFTIPYYVGNPFQPHAGIPTSLGGATTAALALFDAAIAAAQAIWSAVVQVDWTRVGDALTNLNPDFSLAQSFIYSAAGNHGHGVDVDTGFFDGAWNPSEFDPDLDGHVLAHAWGPPDISGFKGNLHLDDDETWVTSGASIGTTSATIDLVSILVHEFGHVLGLGHPGPSSGHIMQPDYWGPLTALSADDITAVRSLYACRGEGCEPPCEGLDCPCTGPDCPCTGPDCSTPVPEPGTLFLFATGLLVLARGSRRRLSA